MEFHDCTSSPFVSLVSSPAGSTVFLALGALAALGAQIQGKPSVEQATALQGLLGRQKMSSQGNMICIFISILCMASARLFG